MTVVPPAFVVTLVNAVVPPTAPPNVVVPVLFTNSVFAPFTVLVNVTLPDPALTTVAPPASVVADTNVTRSFVVVTSPDVVMPVNPVKVTAPSDVMSPVAAIVRVVVSAFSVTTPPFVVVRLWFTAMVSLTSVTPAAAFVFTVPLSVVVPVPSV